MSEVQRELEPGDWFAGYNAPFLVPDSAIAHQLKAFGFEQIQFFDRDQAPPLDPHKDPHYSDDWDAWLRATYRGEKKTVTVPHFDHVAWVLHVPSGSLPSASPPAPSSPAPSPAPSSASGGDALGKLLLAYLILRALGWL